MLKTIQIITAGVPKDVSWTPAGGGDTIQAYSFPCTIVEDGQTKDANVKVYGKGGDTRIKSNLTVSATWKQSAKPEYSCWEVKKADNPHLFPATNNGSGKSREPYNNKAFVNFELEGLKIAMQACQYSGEADPVKMVDQAINIANDKVIPFLRSSTIRHDEKSAQAMQKKTSNAAIRTIITQNGLTKLCQDNKLSPSMLAADFEQAGGNGAAFVSLVRQKYRESVPENPPDGTTEYEDDIPF